MTASFTRATTPSPGGAGDGGRRSRLPWIIGALVAVLAIAAGALFTAYALRTEPDAPPVTSSAADGSDDRSIRREVPPLGVFGTTDPPRVQSFAREHGVDLTFVVDFPSRGTWDEIRWPDYMIDAWRTTDLRPVYGLAMLPDDEDATIEKGATGAYDGHFYEFGRRLVAAGQEDAVLRIGWEFNLGYSRWHSDDPQAFIEYWRKIAYALKAVPGQEFTLDWNVNNGREGEDGTRYYPGDDVVDVVGVDVYDVAVGRSKTTYPYPDDCGDACRTARQEKAWAQTFNGERGLAFWTRFARQHGKPVSIPEWGLWAGDDAEGGGDNPVFIRRMYEYVSNPANNVAYHAYFDNDAEGRLHRLANFPKAAAEFRRLFGDG